MRRVLAVFLDGYEHSLGQRFMSAGEMPEMSRLARLSARFLLDHRAAQRTGLAGEHVATGRSPEAAKRWSAVYFDSRSYSVWQEGARLRPFAADLDCRTVVFDMPYFDIHTAPKVRGVVNWGAHDPGVAPASQPSHLTQEINDQFGPYPAAKWIYGFAWPSEENSRAMGVDLARAVDVRAEATRWLLSERLTDWDLALVAVSEPHSAIEGLWHGIDPTHPLHRMPGAAAAGTGVRAVYQAVDRLIGKLTASFPDAQTVVFAMGGMGENRSDVPSMLLLPELLYRHAFGSEFFKQPEKWNLSTTKCPLLFPDDTWGGRITPQLPLPKPTLRTFAAKALPRSIKAPLRKALARPENPNHPDRQSLNWMPATKYQRFWPSMRAFALPSYYDGRVRLNLVGRERHGVVSVGDYKRVLAEVESLIRACVDPATGESAVELIEYQAPVDPRELAPTQADLAVVWKGTALCLEHPTLGRVGPVPFRRTGGHTGPFGMAYIRSDDIPIGDQGIHNAFDVIPTIVELLGCRQEWLLSGKSLLRLDKAMSALAGFEVQATQ
jgi:predicted AlkP superfamily phosphohydrolase/phosphomutase